MDLKEGFIEDIDFVLVPELELMLNCSVVPTCS